MINLHYYTPQSCYMDRFSHIMHSFYLSILEFIHVSAIDFGSNTIDRYFSNSSSSASAQSENMMATVETKSGNF